MNSIIQRALAGAAIIFLASAAFAQGSKLDQAAQILKQQAKRGRGEFITFLTGAATAYRWASEDDESDSRPLYCLPPDAKFDGRAYANIALEEYNSAKARYRDIPEYPLTVLTLALLHGLQAKYPCETEEEQPDAPQARTSSLQAQAPSIQLAR